MAIENENYEKAKYFNCRAIQNDPSDGWLFTSLGDLYEMTGYPEMANFMYKKALETNNMGKNMKRKLTEKVKYYNHLENNLEE